MLIFVVILLAVVFLGSPVWTSALVAILPRRLPLAIGICVVQGLLAYALWWFYWGGGIGGEAHLPESWQWGFIFAAAPVIVAILRFRRQQPKQSESRALRRR